MFAERTEEPALAGGGHVAVAVRMPTFTPSNWNFGSFFLSISCATACATSLVVGGWTAGGGGWLTFDSSTCWACFKRVESAAQLRVLVRQILQQLRDVVELVQPLQHFAAAIRHAAGLRGFDRANRIADAGCADRAALVVHYRQHHAAVHPARFVGLAYRWASGRDIWDPPCRAW